MTRRFIVRSIGLGLTLVTLSAVQEAAGQTLSKTQLARVDFEQKPGAQIDLSLPFTDESGNRVNLGAYFGQRPVILDLGYYKCPMLCTLVLNGLVASLQALPSGAVGDYEVVCVSISPTEGPALAAAKKRTYLRLYERPGAEAHWHFLTGKEPAIKALAAEVGFHYAYDPSVKQYAHPSGLIILTPEGKVARYFFGVRYASAELQRSLKAAAALKVSSPVQQFLLLCCSFLPLMGKYSGTIMVLVRIAGVLVVVGLAGYMIVSFCREPRSAALPQPGEPEVKEP